MTPKPIPLEHLAYYLGPKAIQHFDRGTQFLNYTGREFPPRGRFPPLKIGIFGSAYDSVQPGILDDRRVEEIYKKPEPRALQIARELGREISKQDQVIVTGGCGGLPYEVIKAAKDYRPKTLVIGISPAPNEEGHLARNMPIRLHDWMFYSGTNENKVGQLLVELGILKEYDAFSFNDRDNRNIEVIDGAIFVLGGSGSGLELMGLWEEGKTAGLVKGLGGVSGTITPTLDEIIKYKNTGASYMAETNPRVLVQRLITQTRLKTISQGNFKVGSVWVYRANGKEIYLNVRDYEVNPNERKIPDVTAPLQHPAFMPEYSLVTKNYDRVAEDLVRGFGMMPINERTIDGELFEANPINLRRLRKSLHAVGTKSPDAIGLIEHVRAKDRIRRAA